MRRRSVGRTLAARRPRVGRASTERRPRVGRSGRFGEWSQRSLRSELNSSTKNRVSCIRVLPYYLVYWCLSNTSVSRIEAPMDDVYRGYYIKSLIGFRRVLIRQFRFRWKKSEKISSFKSNFTKLVFFWWNIFPQTLIETNIREASLNEVVR